MALYQPGQPCSFLPSTRQNLTWRPSETQPGEEAAEVTPNYLP